MEIALTTELPEALSADWLVVGVVRREVAGPKDEKCAESILPDAPFAGLLEKRVVSLVEGKDFDPKASQLLPLYGVDGFVTPRILLVGLGEADSAATPGVLVKAMTAAGRMLASKKPATVALAPLPLADGDRGLESAAIGLGIGVHDGELYRNDPGRKAPERILLCSTVGDKGVVSNAVERARVLSEAVNLARDLVNLPPSELYPEIFCARAADLAKPLGIQVEVLGPPELEKLGMGCLLAVGRESHLGPRLLILRYQGAGGATAKTLGLVGKGITFDSGGLSLKSAENMVHMKCDMAGAATALAATVAAARLKVPTNLLTICPLAENMPGGNAYRVGDVLRAKNGKTIEIVNTDAEGRLVLADALSHAVDLGADHLVDLATLTGACMVALGHTVAGVMTNNEAWSEQVLAAAREMGEKAWPLPMFDDFDEMISSNIADMKNSGGRYGGAITAAKLLVEFVGEVPWTHVDIAGPSFAERDSAAQEAGGTGYFVRTLVRLAEQYRG